MRKLKYAVLAAGVTGAFAFAVASPAGAANSSSCTFEKGTTTCTTVHGSHGTTDTHQGQVQSSGVDRGGGSCKATGSDQTNTC